MARRFSAPYQSEPVSSLATWARNLAVFSVVAVVVSILIVRFGFLEMKPALATFFGALACAGLSILVGLAAFVAIWQNGSRGMSRILLALLIDAVILAYPAYLALQYRKLPPIHDVTTDPIDPPRFEALARGPTPPSMPGCIPPNSSGWPIPISRRWNSTSRCNGPMRSRCNWSPGENGLSSTSVPRSYRDVPAASRRWRGRRSWDSARTCRSASRPTVRDRASISARRHAISRAISAATPRASPS